MSLLYAPPSNPSDCWEIPYGHEPDGWVLCSGYYTCAELPEDTGL